REEERLENVLLHVRGSLGLIELAQLIRGVHQTELPDGVGAQRRILFAFCRRQQVLLVAADHVAAQDGPLDGGIVCRSIDIRERLPRLLSAKETQVFDCFALQVRIALALCDSCENFTRLWRAVLRQEKKGLRFKLGIASAIKNSFHHWNT